MEKYMLGNISFSVPILNASGCWCLDKEQIEELYNSKLGGILAKTCTTLKKDGNAEPNYHYFEKDGVHFNSKGLPNLGYQYYKQLSAKFTDKPYIISIAFENFDNLKILLDDYDKFIQKNSIIEINLSCPNTETDIPGYDIDFIHKLLLFLKECELQNIKFGLKLPPYLQNILMNQIIKVINMFDSILVYIVLSNSIPNCLPLIDGTPILTNIYGGMSGKINKFISVGNVAYFSKKLNKNIKIIGCGGIETIEDIFDYLNNGADFVQLASCFYDHKRNRLNIAKINNLICDFDKNKNV